MAFGCRRVAEAKIEIDPREARGVGDAAPADVDDVQASRCARVGLNTCSLRIARTFVKASMCERAMPPDPSMPTTAAPRRARCFTPIAPSAPTRMCCSTPSLMMASGSPVSIAVSSTSPQNEPGRTQYFSCVTTPSRSPSYTTSDFMRMAK